MSTIKVCHQCLDCEEPSKCPKDKEIKMGMKKAVFKAVKEELADKDFVKGATVGGGTVAGLWALGTVTANIGVIGIAAAVGGGYWLAKKQGWISSN